MTAQPCPICTAQDEDILLQTPKLRVIAVHNDSGSPAFCASFGTDTLPKLPTFRQRNAAN